jgi:hypothetical protein
MVDMGRLVMSLAATLLVLTTVCHAHAQPAEGEKPQAEVLFEQGLDEMMAGNFDKACPALAESYRLEPLAGALFTLAECEAKWGRIGSAVAHYRAFLTRYERMERRRKARQKQRAGVAESQIETLAPEVPLLTLVKHDDAHADMVVKRDGTTVPSGSLGRPIALDPGEHVITVEAPGQPPRSKTLTLERGASSELSLDFEPDVTPGDDDDDDDGGGGDGDAMRLGALIAGGVGLAAGIVSVVTGGLTLGHKDTIESHCSGTQCDQTGLDAADDAEVTGLVSTVGLAVAIAGGATFAVLWLLAPDGSDADTGQEAGWRLTGGLATDPVSRAPAGGTLGVAIDW